MCTTLLNYEECAILEKKKKEKFNMTAKLTVCQLRLEHVAKNKNIKEDC